MRNSEKSQYAAGSRLGLVRYSRSLAYLVLASAFLGVVSLIVVVSGHTTTGIVVGLMSTISLLAMGHILILRQQQQLNISLQALYAVQRENIQKTTRAEFHTKESTRLLSKQLHRIEREHSRELRKLSHIAESLASATPQPDGLAAKLDQILEHLGTGDIDAVNQEHRHSMALEGYLLRILTSTQGLPVHSAVSENRP